MNNCTRDRIARLAWLWLGAFALALAGCGSPPDRASPASVTFALLGDTPYNDSEAHRLDRMLHTINLDRDIELVLHAGDIKSGSSDCSNELFQQRYQQLQSLQRPWIYTPGDNEWTDCHRPPAGAYLPTERLAALRKIFFPQPRLSSGHPAITMETQSDDPNYAAFVENRLVMHRDVLFATLHVVGSNNDLAPWHGLDSKDSPQHPRADRLAEFEARQQAALAWLDHTFSQANTRHASAVVLLMQAEMHMDKPVNHSARQGYERIIQAITRHAEAYTRPILLLYGDDHRHLVDQPLPALPHLTRVQTYGSPFVGWLKIRIHPNASQPFLVEKGK